MVDKAVVIKFFDEMFGSAPVGFLATGFVLPSRVSSRFGRDSSVLFSQWVETQSMQEEQNVYYGFGLIHEDRALGAGQRGGIADMAGMAAIGVDIDIDHPAAHKKDNLPRSEDTALSILADMPRPTFIYNSGHGLQAVWVFSAPVVFASDQHKLDVQEFYHGFIYTLSAKAKSLGYQIDHTQDIARVFRVPGSVNRKIKEDPKPVRVIEWCGARYDLETLAQYISPGALAESKKIISYNVEAIVSGALVLNPMAEPPLDKFDAILENDVKFVQLWNHVDAHGEFISDRSPSSYDYRLALLAAKYGWTDQEICNLLLAHRRKHNCDLNIRARDTYYAATIAKARTFLKDSESKKEQREREKQLEAEYVAELAQQTSVASSVLRDMAAVAAEEDAQLDAAKLQMPEPVRDEARAKASAILNVEISRVWKYVTTPPTFSLVVNGVQTRSLSSVEIDSQTKFRQIIAETTGIRFGKLKTSQWDIVASSIFLAAEVDEKFGNNDDADICRSLLEEYLRENPPVEGDKDDIANAIIRNQPAFTEGCVVISLMAFANWRDRRGFASTIQSLSFSLRRLGAASIRSGFSSRSLGSAQRSVWRLPREFSECRKSTIEHGTVFVPAGGFHDHTNV